MKKLLLFAVVFVMLFSVAAAEGGLDESPLYGTYLRAVEYSSGNYSLELFHLFPDHTAYYLLRWVSDGKIEDQYEELTSWLFSTKNARVQLVVNGGIMEFTMGNYGELKTTDKLPDVFTKVYPRRDWQ